MSGLELLLLTLFVAVAFFIAGFVADAVLKNDGFGPYWNGVLALVGMMLGSQLRSSYFPLHSPYDPLLTLSFVFGVCVAFLLVLAAFRNKLA